MLFPSLPVPTFWHLALCALRFFPSLFGYACLLMCMGCCNQKFCLVILEGFVIVSYTLVEMTGLLSPGTSGVSRKSPAGRLPPLLTWEPCVKVIPKWRYILQLTVSGRPSLLSGSGDVTGTDIWFFSDLQRTTTKLKFRSRCYRRHLPSVDAGFTGAGLLAQGLLCFWYNNNPLVNASSLWGLDQDVMPVA